MEKLKKINYKKLILITVITIVVGSAFAFFTVTNEHLIDTLNKPKLYPPKILFPIVWTIIYILMSIGLYIISEANVKEKEKQDAYNIYGFQLILNSLWTLIFFGLQRRLLAFVLIIVLLISVIIMTIKFYKISKTAGLLQILYVIWLLLASYLNLSIYLLN